MDNLAFYAKLAILLKDHTPVWQASIIESDGSTPAKIGMKLAIPLNSEPFGNLGGGELEHKVIEIIRQEKPRQALIYSFNLSADGLKAGIATSMLCGGAAKVYIEPLFYTDKLYIIGAGHCGKALGKIACLCGFYVHLIDNRQEIIANLPQDCYHYATQHDYADLTEVMDFDSDSWIVIMTQGHIHDKDVLEQCLRKSFRYLGMIGSKNKAAATFAQLKEKGFTDDELAKCHSPVGLPIGSHTPFEIAISILAELISFRNLKQ
ncbi:MAG: XdhC/CoxI family protein [Candidatus Cloacimonas sp.]